MRREKSPCAKKPAVTIELECASAAARSPFDIRSAASPCERRRTLISPRTCSSSASRVETFCATWGAAEVVGHAAEAIERLQRRAAAA